MKRTCLYRHYDELDTLLYVGISLNAIKRLCQHKDKSAWFEKIARVQMQWYETREQALTAEAIAIAKEGPLWNQVRPFVPGAAREAPLRWAENAVQCVGEPLHKEIWRGRQWSVTEYGLEARDGRYAIEWRDIDNPRAGKHSMLRHVLEKVWVDRDDFREAYHTARWIHFGDRESLFDLQRVF